MVWGESETYIDMKNDRIRELEAQLAVITADRNLYRDDRDEEGHPYSEVVALRERLAERDRTIELLRGAMAAQDERERDAAKRLGMIHNCDWPDNVADEMEARDRTIAGFSKRLCLNHCATMSGDRMLRNDGKCEICALQEQLKALRTIVVHYQQSGRWHFECGNGKELCGLCRRAEVALNPPAKERP